MCDDSFRRAPNETAPLPVETADTAQLQSRNEYGDALAFGMLVNAIKNSRRNGKDAIIGPAQVAVFDDTIIGEQTVQPDMIARRTKFVNRLARLAIVSEIDTHLWADAAPDDKHVAVRAVAEFGEHVLVEETTSTNSTEVPIRYAYSVYPSEVLELARVNNACE